MGFRVDVHTLEPRPEGALHYDMVADTAEMVASMKEMGRPGSTEIHCRFSTFEPHSQLAIKSVIDFIPGVAAYESTISVAFFQLGEDARMVVTLAPMHAEEFTRMSAEGFTSQLTKLDARFANAG